MKVSCLKGQTLREMGFPQLYVHACFNVPCFCAYCYFCNLSMLYLSLLDLFWRVTDCFYLIVFKVCVLYSCNLWVFCLLVFKLCVLYPCTKMVYNVTVDFQRPTENFYIFLYAIVTVRKTETFISFYANKELYRNKYR